MKRSIAIAAALLISSPLLADSPSPKKGIEGYWVGALKIGAIELRLGFKIERKDGKLIATVDSIDQGVKDIPIESVEFADGTLTIKSPKMMAGYVGKLDADGDTIKGEFEQTGKLPLDLKRMDKGLALVRPQEPKKPYP